MSEDLATYAATRDPQLREQLAVRHLPLAKFVARKMSANMPANVDLDDLVSWGAMGLLDAIDKFDPGREVKFSTYAVTRIRGAILDGLQKMDWAPKQVTSRVRHLRRAQEELRHLLNRDPSVEELAQKLEVPECDVRAWLLDEASQRMKTLDAPAGDDEQGAHLDLAVAADQDVAGEVAEIRARTAAVLNSLGERDQQVFTLYYVEGKTLREIALQLGISVSSATQAHTRLVDQIRHRLAAYGSVA